MILFCYPPEQCYSFLRISACGGMGKSTEMKHLAISWADGTSEELKKFDFVFHIALKFVKGNDPTENIIITEHSGLKANEVSPTEIKSILEDEHHKVLLLIDGHDEYKTGRNTDIDEAIKKEKLWNCWMIITSRETEQIKELKDNMDAEADICGFDEENIKCYIEKLLDSTTKANELLEQAKQTGLRLTEDYKYGKTLLRIPILLNMICILFSVSSALPETLTGIVQAIVDRCMDREALRTRGVKAEEAAKQALLNLGKLAWQGLCEPGKKLIFTKVSTLTLTLH